MRDVVTEPDHALGLSELARRVRRDLDLLGYPSRPWLSPRSTATGDVIHDVIIVGGGQSGLTAAFGLLRERVSNLLVLDQNPLDRAGPWLNFARMRTLRTPKYLTGPDLGIPNLTPRAWYEARFGESAWQALGHAAEGVVGRVSGLVPRNSEHPRASGKRGWARSVTTTRRGIFWCPVATRAVSARCARGAWYWRRASRARASGACRARSSSALPAHLYAHTRDDIDFDALRGKRIAVLGAGASAFDNAATALEAGAREVHVFFRRPQLVNVNPYRWAEFVGFLKHQADLPDADKWRFILQILRMGQLPPKDTLTRAQAHAGFQLHAGAEWKTLTAQADQVVMETESERFEVDFVIVATGCVTDLAARPELAHFESHIARWADRYTPPLEDQHEDLARHPYLGPGFEFTERRPGEAPFLSHLYNYTFGGLASLGFGGASISGLKYSAPKLVAGITRSLFLEDSAVHFDSLCNYAVPEF